MKPLPSVEIVKSALSYDPKSGTFRWNRRSDRPQKWNTRYAGTVAGFISKVGYVIIMIGKGNNYAAHRLAWLYVHGVDPEDQLDHINGIRHDNRITNLRLATNSLNCRNRNIQRNNTSGYPGVNWSTQRKMWEARITVNKRCVWRKFFDIAREAHEARCAVLAEHHGEFAKIDPKPREYVQSRHRYPKK